MSTISAAAVKSLRDRTNAPMMDCKAALAEALARQMALKVPATVQDLLAQPFVDDPKKTVNDRISEVVGILRENMKPARFKQLKGLTGSYVHHDGSVGVLLQVEGDKADP